MRDPEFLLSLHNGRVLPQTRDGRDYSAAFEVLDSRYRGAPDEAQHVHRGKILVGISGSLLAQWAVTEEQLEPFLHRLAVNYLANRVRLADLTDREELQLTTYNAPQDSPISLEGLEVLPNPISVVLTRP